MKSNIQSALWWGRLVAALVLAGLLTAPVLAAERPGSSWGLGWEDGLTVRRWLGQRWELGVAVGPDDYLVKTEAQTWSQTDPATLRGALEVPVDNREEHGWVRGQIGYRINQRQDFSLVGYSGLVYNWINYQERSLELDNLVGEYDTWELDRFTERWILSLGLRPTWRPVDFMTVEFAMGLNFIWESWDQTTEQVAAGVAGSDRSVDSGHSRRFEDFGWQGAASLQFFFWF